jgi:predicted outer membrane repeat protein
MSSGNTSGSNGGGVYVAKGRFEMSSGEISDNPTTLAGRVCDLSGSSASP